MRDLGGGKTLLEFVCELPVLKAMEEDKGKGGFLALSTSGSPTDITEELNAVVKKLVIIIYFCCTLSTKSVKFFVCVSVCG